MRIPGAVRRVCRSADALYCQCVSLEKGVVENRAVHRHNTVNIVKVRSNTRNVHNRTNHLIL